MFTIAMSISKSPWLNLILKPPMWLKVVIGAGTIWPLVYMVIFAGIVLHDLYPGGNRFSDDIVWVLVPFHLFTMVECAAVITSCLVFLFNQPGFTESRRILWLLLILQMGVLSMPVFFFLYIWPVSTEAAAASSVDTDHQPASASA